MSIKILPLCVGQAAVFAFLAVCPLAAQSELQQNTDYTLQRSLERTVQELGLRPALRENRLAVALVDVTEPQRPRYAAVNDTVMMYAASLPKIAIILAGFERISAGLLEYTPAVRQMFTRLVRFSSNVDASKAIQTIGFDYISRVLTCNAYRLYDPRLNGGLWLGKAYGGPNDYWKADPLHHISHGATALQVARFFLMLDQGKLVNPAYSAEMKEILSKPAIEHKFVKGLAAIGVRDVYRKSGTWQDWHSDAALVEHNGHKYIAVALMKDQRGGEVLPKLIQGLDRLIVNGAAALQPTWPSEE
jgi:beta-lactamase class A